MDSVNTAHIDILLQQGPETWTEEHKANLCIFVRKLLYSLPMPTGDAFTLFSLLLMSNALDAYLPNTLGFKEMGARIFL